MKQSLTALYTLYELLDDNTELVVKAIRQIAEDKRPTRRIRKYVEYLRHEILYKSVMICLEDKDRLQEWKNGTK